VLRDLCGEHIELVICELQDQLIRVAATPARFATSPHAHFSAERGILLHYASVYVGGDAWRASGISQPGFAGGASAAAGRSSISPVMQGYRNGT
jgi:hypothetical protein